MSQNTDIQLTSTAEVSVDVPMSSNPALDLMVNEIPENTGNDQIVGLVRKSALNAVKKLYPNDPTTDRDDRIRELVVEFFARSAQKTAEHLTGVAFTDNELNMVEKIQMIRETMVFVQRFPGLNGHEKKAAVVKAIVQSVKHYKPETTQFEINEISALAASTIELAVDIKHGRVDIGQVVEFGLELATSSCATKCCFPTKPLKKQTNKQ